jgi:beta-lactamase superfamily II metal-dependent hydrolase
MLKIKMYPAENGDAFLLSAIGKNVLIDGGYAKTFDNHILNDLRNLSRNGEALDLVITTHIDSDHIGGVIRFLSSNGTVDQSKIIKIKEIWHNSLRCLTSPLESEIRAEDFALLTSINRRGHPVIAADEDKCPETISAKQGSTLASLIYNGGYLWNGGDGSNRISANSRLTAETPGLTIDVITPSEKRLQELLKKWKRELKRYGYKGPLATGDVIDDAFEYMMEHQSQASDPALVLLSGRQKKLEEIYTPDTSIPNGSSISTIIELNGIRLLMLADAWSEDVVEILTRLRDRGESMSFDVVKISHHGSLHNTSPKLLKIIDAPKYFISSNGSKHNHPDIELLKAIVDRPANFHRTIYFNYSTIASSEMRSYETETGAPFSIVENAIDWIDIRESK